MNVNWLSILISCNRSVRYSDDSFESDASSDDTTTKNNLTEEKSENIYDPVYSPLSSYQVKFFYIENSNHNETYEKTNTSC